MKHKTTLLMFLGTALFLSLLTASQAQAQASQTELEKATAHEDYPQENSITLSQRAKELAEQAFIGSWEGTLTPEEGGPPPFRILFTFGAGGTVVATDAGPPSPHLASSEHGAWKYIGNREFLVTYKQLLFNDKGELDSLFKGRIRFRLTRAGLEISGPVIVDFYDAQGNPLFSGAGTIKCTKIQAEPLH